MRFEGDVLEQEALRGVDLLGQEPTLPRQLLALGAGHLLYSRRPGQQGREGRITRLALCERAVGERIVDAVGPDMEERVRLQKRRGARSLRVGADGGLGGEDR
jgi:hypothetical protein